MVFAERCAVTSLCISSSEAKCALAMPLAVYTGTSSSVERGDRGKGPPWGEGEPRRERGGVPPYVPIEVLVRKAGAGDCILIELGLRLIAVGLRCMEGVGDRRVLLYADIEEGLRWNVRAGWLALGEEVSEWENERLEEATGTGDAVPELRESWFRDFERASLGEGEGNLLFTFGELPPPSFGAGAFEAMV